MCLDALLRLVVVILIFSFEEELFERFLDDTFDCLLYLFDLMSVIPFLITTIAPLLPFISSPQLQQQLQFLFRCLELFSSSKILRMTKDYPNILAIRITLLRSFKYLIIPIYFYFVFNIFFGAIIYLLEPCYRYDTCSWDNLFESSFYSVVTMTTSKNRSFLTSLSLLSTHFAILLLPPPLDSPQPVMETRSRPFSLLVSLARSSCFLVPFSYQCLWLLLEMNITMFGPLSNKTVKWIFLRMSSNSSMKKK